MKTSLQQPLPSALPVIPVELSPLAVARIPERQESGSLPLCFYGDTIDALAGAWVVRKAFDGEVELHQVGAIAEGFWGVKDRDVFLVGVPFAHVTFSSILKSAASLTVFAVEHLGPDRLDLPGAIVRHDSGHAVCKLAWRYFFQEQRPPVILEVIEDDALSWYQKFRTREVMAWLRSFPREIANFDQWCAVNSFRDQVCDGIAILRNRNRELEFILPMVTRTMLIGEHSVPVSNLPPTMAAEAGKRLAVGHPFAAIYSDGPTHREFRLFAAPGGIDVSRIARRYGGHGNPHQAEFRVDRKTAWLMECDE